MNAKQWYQRRVHGVKETVRKLTAFFGFDKERIMQAILNTRSLHMDQLANYIYDMAPSTSSLPNGAKPSIDISGNPYVNGDYGRHYERPGSGGFGSEYEACEQIESVIIDTDNVAAQVLGD
eukprot:TRINITY_DN3357_c0_g1_i1.p1 TRINITY_DN3357_c0_g1~~TRINITY_DN3357_c0_g1_i1.p1  ORF type:complete len:121 (-),score=24.19 TRINITY_DN3357_c0_g1_i1:146-508(-)